MDRRRFHHRAGRYALNRRRFLAGATAAGTGLFLLACGGKSNNAGQPANNRVITVGGSGSSSGAATAAASTPATGTPTASAQPVTGGTLNIVDARNWSSDPLVDSTSAANVFAGYIYSRLVRYKGNTDPNARGIVLAPDLAASWQQPDPLTFIFKLNPAAKFHNKPPVAGRAVTADDVVQSYKRITTEPKNTNKDKLLQVVDGQPTAIDDHTVQFKTKSPFSPFLGGLIANPQYLWVYPKELLTDDNARASSPVGSGPWMYKSRQEDVAWFFDKNPDYFLKDDAGRSIPYLDAIKLNVIPESAQQLAQFIGGNLDIAPLQFAQVKQVQDQLKDAIILKSQFSAGYRFLSPQQRRPPFTDVRLRQALSLSCDTDGWLKLLSGGDGWRNNLVAVYLGDWWLDPKDPRMGDAAQYFKYDPQAAKQLISAAGFHDAFQYIYSNNGYGDLFNHEALFWADTAKRAGFDNLQVVTQDYRSQYITAGKTFFGFYDGVFCGTEAPQADPYGMVYNMLYDPSANSWNHAGVNDPQINQLIDALAAEFDNSKRHDIVFNIQIASAKNMYYPMGAALPGFSSRRGWVQNFAFIPQSYATGSENYAYVWIDPKLKKG